MWTKANEASGQKVTGITIVQMPVLVGQSWLINCLYLYNKALPATLVQDASFYKLQSAVQNLVYILTERVVTSQLSIHVQPCNH